MNSTISDTDIYKNLQQIRYTLMTTTQNQIKKINDMWAKGERNKASIMKAVGVSRKTLLKYLKQAPVQQTIPSERTNTAPELKPKHTHQQPVQATQSPEQLTNETHQPRKWTWEEIEEYTRPDPETEQVNDYRFDNLGSPPWEQELQMQSPYYQYPVEYLQQDPQYNREKDELARIKEEIIKRDEQKHMEYKEFFRNMKEQISQIKNKQADQQNLRQQQQKTESDPNKATPVIEEYKPIRFTFDLRSPAPEETNNQNISTSFTPATKINLTKSDEKHHTAEANQEEPIHTVEKGKKMWEESVKKTLSKEDRKSDIATSKYDMKNLQNRQNAKVASAVALKKTDPIEKKEETEQDSLEISILSVVKFLVDIGTGLIRSTWENKPIELQPLEQRNNKNLSDYQNISNPEPIVLQPVVKKDNKKHDQQNYYITYLVQW